MIKNIFVYAFLLISIQSLGQTAKSEKEKYINHLQRATQLFTEKKYKLSGLCYDSLLSRFYVTGVTGYDKYNAACAWALAGDKEKPFLYLFNLAIENSYAAYSQVSSDVNLKSLHSDNRWKLLLDIVKDNNEKNRQVIKVDSSRFNKSLMATLDTIFNEDQLGRKNIKEFEKQYGLNSKQRDSLINKMAFIDSINLIKVKKIIDEHGWLGADEVGDQGASTLFLVIQHADFLTQVTYFPIMKEAVAKGKARASELAMLEDRILIQQGKPQIYGTQVRINSQTGKHEFYPIVDEPNVNTRRFAAHLPPLEDYAKIFGFDYEMPAPTKNSDK